MKNIPEEELRPAELVLHKKRSGLKTCICGSRMKYVYRNGWVCKRQYELDEPNDIVVYLPHKNAIFYLFDKRNKK